MVEYNTGPCDCCGDACDLGTNCKIVRGVGKATNDPIDVSFSDPAFGDHFEPCGPPYPEPPPGEVFYLCSTAHDQIAAEINPVPTGGNAGGLSTGRIWEWGSSYLYSCAWDDASPPFGGAFGEAIVTIREECIGGSCVASVTIEFSQSGTANTDYLRFVYTAPGPIDLSGVPYELLFDSVEQAGVIGCANDIYPASVFLTEP